MTVTVYSSPRCQQCTATIRSLSSQNIDHEVIDISQDENAHAFVTKELGYKQAPVVIIGDHHWSGFRPDKLSQLVAA